MFSRQRMPPVLHLRVDWLCGLPLLVLPAQAASKEQPDRLTIFNRTAVKCGAIEEIPISESLLRGRKKGANRSTHFLLRRFVGRVSFT